MAATSKMTSPMARMTVLASMALNCTVRSHQGTPKEETYHQAFQPAKVNASSSTTAASENVRARAERRARRESTTAPSAATAPATPA